MIAILIVEDDADVGNLLTQYLTLNDFKVERVYNGKEALLALEKSCFDMILLDVMMPELNGFDLAQKIKAKNPEQAFLFLTARAQKKDVLNGLKIGADDYITKPFDCDELILRIHNILKRYPKKELPEQYVLGDYVFLPHALSLIHNGKEETEQFLTQKESDLLCLFCEYQNRLLRKEDILKNLWEETDFFSARSLDVFVSRLRKYLKQDSRLKIESLRGVGYYFRVEKGF